MCFFLVGNTDMHLGALFCLHQKLDCDLFGLCSAVLSAAYRYVDKG